MIGYIDFAESVFGNVYVFSFFMGVLIWCCLEVVLFFYRSLRDEESKDEEWMYDE